MRQAPSPPASRGENPQLPPATAAAQGQHPLPFRFLPTRPTPWDPEAALAGGPCLNVRLDGCIVPSEASPAGARVSYSHLVVLDDFIGEEERRQLLELLTSPEVAAGAPPPPAEQQPPAAAASGAAAAGGLVRATGGDQGQGGHPWLPSVKWELGLSDMAGAAPTFGVRPAVLAELARMELPAMREVHARLARLLPGYDIALLPSEAIQSAGSGGSGERAAGAAGASGRGQQVAAAAAAGVDCAAFVANAAVAGDTFAWHVDADPTSFPAPSPFLDAYGDYFNGEPGKPLLASLMLYLNPEWRREWGAETLFLDAASDAGVFVVPRPRRAVLFHQDLLHRVSPPAAAAGGRPRFSLVWKLALLPKAGGSTGGGGIARPEWGPPASFGSAARVDAVVRQLGREHQQQQRGKRQRPAAER